MISLFVYPAYGKVLTEPKAAKQPNIILILADDLGYGELGCYGNTFNQTPNLDKLAAGGMRFTQAYAAAPVCTPTRIALLTGQHPARVGITDYLDVHDEKFLSPDYETLNEKLKKAGYVTGLVGKWHLTGDYEKRRGEPEKHGWDEVIASERKYIANGDYFYPYFFLPDLAARGPDEYLTDRLNLEAHDFIQRHKNKPFFLYLSHYAVHTKLGGKPAKVTKYQSQPGVGKNQNNPELAAMLESLDDGIGQLQTTLQANNLDQNTLIIFTSDNGGELNVTRNGSLRGGKSELYEGGIRVPFLAYWPNRIKANVISPVPVTTADIYPTLLEVVGVKPTKGQILDGSSIAALLAGKTQRPETTFYWHYPLPKPHFLGGRSASAIRQGDYKLIQFLDDHHPELYNLKNDPSEKQDLAATLPDKVTALQKELQKWQVRVGAKM
ncbi:sulfatase [Adhaeribacter pallidiroseus]|uniref:Arylsulfatase n=1 Tax=Adhaeribacter pallidiroseus TaxID=2072847 RepID=A0A369QJE3_9BACT|nr:sulfatase [Adhaeribacter pallidiroseus]RDC64512.1 Arylsulfatase [Adhaeribacter pallidiroseus]